MGPILCSESSVMNSHCTLRNFPEEGRPQLFGFLPPRVFKLLGQIKRNSINDCDFFKVRNFRYGHQLWLFVPDSKNLATPLTGQYSWLFCYVGWSSLGSVEYSLHGIAVWQLISHSSAYTEELLVAQLVKKSLNFVKL
jgi:hypothetical protein